MSNIFTGNITANKLSGKDNNMTAEEAWELAKKIATMMASDRISLDEQIEIFSTPFTSEILSNFTPQEAKAKMEEWEKTKEVFQQGDVVQNVNDENVKVLITRRYTDGTYNGIDASGATYSEINKKNWEKTGRHYDIGSILEQFKKEEPNG